MIRAAIVEDSINEHKNRLTTFLLVYPRFVHAQIMTHRMFSRNVSSSRAIPVERMIEDILENPAEPIYYGKNQKGMVAKAQLGEGELWAAEQVWADAMMDAIEHARRLSKLGLHKQHANRLLEPFSHVKTVLTATEFDNFFQLRLHHDAQPEMQEIAVQMKELLDFSAPQEVAIGSWHLPFVWSYERSTYADNPTLLRISAARCARVSYASFVTKKLSETGEDTKLAEKLLQDRHLSPFEHQATPLATQEMSANFKGWMSWRKILEANNSKSIE
jgi:thymidylate synthase ThyX